MVKTRIKRKKNQYAMPVDDILLFEFVFSSFRIFPQRRRDRREKLK
jgi:hypothetical protein